MSHHMNEMSADLRKYLNIPDDLGATGAFPRGQLCPEDEGEIRIAIAADPRTGTVLIDFGKPIASIGFSAEQASDLADLLAAKALEVRGVTP